MADDIFSQFPTATWAVGGKRLAFAVQNIEELSGNRLAKHRRLYRDGVRIDDTGGEGRAWVLTCPFFNDAEHEPGVDGLAQYPDNADAICDSFDVHEVGDLTTPTRGPRRCRAEHYRRVDTADARDMCVITLTFVEDNEDDARAAAYTSPSAQSVIASLTSEAVGSCADAGAWNEDLSSLQNLAADLQGMAAAPWQFVDDMESKANAFEKSCAAVEKAFTGAAERGAAEAETMLTEPEASFAGRRLRAASDTAASLSAQKFAGGEPNVSTRTYDREMSIFAVATDANQPADGLIELNGHLPDMLAIEAGTPVKVFDR